MKKLMLTSNFFRKLVCMFERNLEELIKFRGIDNSGVDNYRWLKGGILTVATTVRTVKYPGKGQYCTMYSGTAVLLVGATVLYV